MNRLISRSGSVGQTVRSRIHTASVDSGLGCHARPSGLALQPGTYGTGKPWGLAPELIDERRRDTTRAVVSALVCVVSIRSLILLLCASRLRWRLF